MSVNEMRHKAVLWYRNMPEIFYCGHAKNYSSSLHGSEPPLLHLTLSAPTLVQAYVIAMAATLLTTNKYQVKLTHQWFNVHCLLVKHPACARIQSSAEFCCKRCTFRLLLGPNYSLLLESHCERLIFLKPKAQLSAQNSTGKLESHLLG